MALPCECLTLVLFKNITHACLKRSSGSSYHECCRTMPLEYYSTKQTLDGTTWEVCSILSLSSLLLVCTTHVVHLKGYAYGSVFLVFCCGLVSVNSTQDYFIDMMTSSNGNIFRVTGHLCGEFTGLRWIPLTKASDAELWYFLWSASE